MNAPRHLTVRNVPSHLGVALKREARRRGTSMNGTVIELLSRALGVDQAPSNGLADLAGTWSEDDLAEFEAAVGRRQVDDEIWR